MIGKGVPSPDETPVEVAVSGRTSTLKSIKIVKVGHHIPKTFSRDLLRNTPGFAWYVSRHFALKTDVPDKAARRYLALLELAYPHYVAAFGQTLHDFRDRRMACIYGSSKARLDVAMLSDAMHVFGGGGITQEGFYCTYQYPSNEYHGRYILIHECVHLYQYCLNGTTTNTPIFYLEGIADSLSSHVYDPRRRRLTVDVLDRAPPHNFLEYGKALLKKNPRLTFEKLHQGKGGDRGTNVLMVQFLRHTPERLQKWRAYQEELFRTATPANKTEVSARLLVRLYGPWRKINAEFAEWVKSLRPTFHQADWGFDQYGDALVSFGTPRASRFSQMDIHLAPKDRPRPGDFHMDYPAQPVPPIVGPVQRGVAEPSVGCIVDFSPAPGRGMAGLGLGRVGYKHLRLLIDRQRALVIDGTALGKKRKRVVLPKPLRAAMQRDGHRIGLTAKIGRKTLEVTLRAGAKGTQPFRTSIPITPSLRRRLRTKPMAVLGRGARHLVTPILDDGRPAAPDLRKPASPDRWRQPCDRPLHRAVKACWHLGRRAPKLLLRERARLLAAASQPRAIQEEALRAFQKSLPQVVRAIHRCGAARKTVALALADFCGASLHILLRDARAGSCRATAILEGAVAGRLAGRIRFEGGPDGMIRRGAPASTPGGALKPQAVRVDPDGAVEVTRVFKAPPMDRPFYVEAKADLLWYGVPISLRAMKVGHGGIPHYWLIGPLDSEGKFEDKPYEIETQPLNLEQIHTGQGGTKIAWRKVERDPSLPVDAEHLLYLNERFGQANGAFAYALVWVEAPRALDAVLAVGASDGLVAWVNGKKVHTMLKRRDWSPREDRIPVRFKKGRNRVLLKSIHGGGLWFLSAHIEDGRGRPLGGVTTTLDNPPDPTR